MIVGLEPSATLIATIRRHVLNMLRSRYEPMDIKLPGHLLREVKTAARRAIAELVVEGLVELIDEDRSLQLTIKGRTEGGSHRPAGTVGSHC